MKTNQKHKLRVFSFSLMTGLFLAACGGPSGPKVDKEIMDAIKTVASKCDINEKRGWIDKCPGEEKKIVRAFFDKDPKTKKPRKEKYASLDTFSVALQDKDPKVAVVAADALNSKYRSLEPPTESTPLKPEVSKRMIAALGKTPESLFSKIAEPVTYVATLGDQSEALYQVIDKLEDKKMARNIYPHLMKYGRLKTFPKIQDVVKNGNEADAAAALKAPRNMSKRTEQENQAICSWAKGYLSDERERVYHGAGRLMIGCKGEYIDALLDEGEKRLAKHQFTRDDYLLYRDVCFSFMKGVTEEAGKAKQCNRTFAFLEKAVNDEELKSMSRGLALFAIYYQRRDAETLKLMRKYENHADPKIQKYAKESIESLKKHYKIEG